MSPKKLPAGTHGQTLQRLIGGLAEGRDRPERRAAPSAPPAVVCVLASAHDDRVGHLDNDMVEPPRFVIVESRSQDKTQKLRGAPVPAAGRGQQGDNQQYCQQDSRAHRASTSRPGRGSRRPARGSHWAPGQSRRPGGRRCPAGRWSLAGKNHCIRALPG